jgi:hypothetical protein
MTAVQVVASKPAPILGDRIACGPEGELTGKIERYGATSMRIRRASWYHEITTTNIAPI